MPVKLFLAIALSALACTATLALALASSPELHLRQELLPPSSGELGPAEQEAGVTLQLSARFDCGADDATASLFVSVAETSVALPVAKSPQPVTLQLPEPQLRGVRESLACPGLGPHLLRDQITAFATVICRGPEGAEHSTTVNRPLSLWVDCLEPPAEADDEPENAEEAAAQ